MDLLPKDIEDIILNYKKEFEKINPYKFYVNKTFIKNREITTYEFENRKRYIIIPINIKNSNVKKLISIFICKKYLNIYSYSNKLKTTILKKINSITNHDFHKKYFKIIKYIVLDDYEQLYIVNILKIKSKNINYKNDLLKTFLNYISSYDN